MPDKVTVSDKPWSDYKEADYTLEQWHAACLIHQHQGPPTSKAQCKLPVRTPNGTLNRNGVHAAAAALAGARGGVNATSEEKAKAAAAIIRCYAQLDEKPPPSMGMMTQDDLNNLNAFLSHLQTHEAGGGGGKFDESKVKRDKGGKFAKKEGLGNKSIEDLMDGLWMDKWSVDTNYWAIMKPFQREMTMLQATWSINGGAVDSTFEKQVSSFVDKYNAASEKSDAGVSPSGTRVLHVNFDKDNGFQPKIESYSGPNPHPEITRTVRAQAETNLRLARQDKSKSGFRFNPNAVLDPSRVHNVSHADGEVAMDEVEDFLRHVGVKGMRWGVRKSEPSAAQQLRAKVKAGEGTIGEAHHAALKSTGHRAANFFLGDKTYWKRTAQILGITAAAVAVAAIPGLVPAAALSGVASGIFLASNSASSVNTLANFHRALFGNRKITKSMENLGKDVRRRQKDADEKTKKLLNKYGSIPKKSLEHSEEFLAHADSNQTVQEVWDSLSSAQLDTAEILIGLALDESNAEGVVIDSDVYNSMSDIQKTVVTFVMAGALADAEETVQHSSLLDRFLKHYGVKGMRWGVRKDDSAGGSKSKGPSKKEVKIAEAAKDVHVSADAERFVKTRMKAKHEMSDREIREAVQRAEWAKKYDAAFNPDANAQLQAKVNQLKLQKEYGQLSREMNPTKIDRVNNFLTKANSAYQAYDNINSLSGGVLNATLAKSMGLTKQESHYDRLLRENKILSAEKEHSTLLRDLDEPMIKRDYFPKHSTTTPVGRHQLDLPGKHRA